MANRPSSGHAVAFGITDLMTSLVVVFAVLLVAFANAARPPEERPVVPAESPTIDRERPRVEPARDVLERISPVGVAIAADRVDPQLLRVVIPDSLLEFQSGKSALTPAADDFVGAAMPIYANVLCGTLRAHVEAIVIEGHTDDLGDDAANLRLSQERSLRVLVRALDAIRDATPGAYACFAELASASGRGKQDLVYDAEGLPDRERSRRVVLKILLRGTATRS